jgi:hypothetical protein
MDVVVGLPGAEAGALLALVLGWLDDPALLA